MVIPRRDSLEHHPGSASRSVATHWADSLGGRGGAAGLTRKARTSTTHPRALQHGVARGLTMVFSGVRAMRTASALNSGENVRRVRGGLDDFFMDTSIMTGEGWEVSTKSGQLPPYPGRLTPWASRSVATHSLGLTPWASRLVATHSLGDSLPGRADRLRLTPWATHSLGDSLPGRLTPWATHSLGDSLPGPSPGSPASSTQALDNPSEVLRLTPRRSSRRRPWALAASCAARPPRARSSAHRVGHRRRGRSARPCRRTRWRRR